jgi:hypothetical protein
MMVTGLPDGPGGLHVELLLDKHLAAVIRNTWNIYNEIKRET